MVKKILAFVLACSAAALSHASMMNAHAPDFTLADSQGKQRPLSDYKGKVVFVNFWASWCDPCKAELPLLNQLAIDERGRNVSVLAINVDQEKYKASALLAALGIETPEMGILWDPESKAVAAYDPDTMPSSFILDGRGTIRFVHSGFHKRDPKEWRKEIDGLLSSQEKDSKAADAPPHP